MSKEELTWRVRVKDQEGIRWATELYFADDPRWKGWTVRNLEERSQYTDFWFHQHDPEVAVESHDELREILRAW